MSTPTLNIDEQRNTVEINEEVNKLFVDETGLSNLTPSVTTTKLIVEDGDKTKFLVTKDARLEIQSLEVNLKTTREDPILIVNDYPYLLNVIADDNRLVIKEPELKLISVAQQGPQGPAGGGLTSIIDDPSPELGGDLVLGPHNIIGQLENTSFVLDGGLI